MVVPAAEGCAGLDPDLGEDAQIDDACARLQQMIERGEATLIAQFIRPGRKLGRNSRWSRLRTSGMARNLSR